MKIRTWRRVICDFKACQGRNATFHEAVILAPISLLLSLFRLREHRKGDDGRCPAGKSSRSSERPARPFEQIPRYQRGQPGVSWRPFPLQPQPPGQASELAPHLHMILPVCREELISLIVKDRVSHGCGCGYVNRHRHAGGCDHASGCVESPRNLPASTTDAAATYTAPQSRPQPHRAPSQSSDR